MKFVWKCISVCIIAIVLVGGICLLQLNNKKDDEMPKNSIMAPLKLPGSDKYLRSQHQRSLEKAINRYNKMNFDPVIREEVDRCILILYYPLESQQSYDDCMEQNVFPLLDED